MKVDDKILREILQRKIKEVNKLPRAAFQSVESYMVNEYNVKHGDIVSILNGTMPIEVLGYDMLYKLMKSIEGGVYKYWEHSNEEQLNINLSELDEDIYFTDIEIEEFSRPVDNKVYDSDIIFTEWIQITPDQYVVKATIDEIIQWRNLNKIKYNPETQRDMTVKNSKGVEIKVVTLNKKSIKEMYELMINGDFIPDDLTFNINTDINIKGEQLPHISYDNLIIPKEALIDIIDGFHRYYTMCTVKDANPDWQFTCIINITMWDTEKANRFMLQRDKKNHLSDKQTTRIDKRSETNYVIDRLNNSRKFHWNGKIDNDTHFELNNIITDIFNPTTREEAVLLHKSIEENINLVIEENSYFDKQFTKEEWFVYLYLIKKTQDEKIDYIDLIDRLDVDKLIEKIEFKRKPRKLHYKLIDDMVGRVMSHV